MAEQGWLRRLGLHRVWMLAVLVLSGVAAALTTPAVQQGVAWLAAQVQADGSLSNESSSVAAPLQSRDEAARTLQLLSASSTAPDVTQDDTSGTEYLARQILSLSLRGVDVSSQLAALAARQNADGGFGVTQGDPSSAQDSAWALAALAKAQSAYSANIGTLKAYLYSQVLPDGGLSGLSFRARIQGTELLLLALQSLTADAAQQAAIQQLSAWLAQQQGTNGSWNEDVYLTAYALTALVPVSTDSNMQQIAAAFLLAKQGSDGSWNADPFLTATVLRALSLASIPPSNAIVGQVVSAANSQPLSAVLVTINGTAIMAATDNQGNFQLRGLPSGSQSLTFTLSGFQNGSATVVVPSSGTVNMGNIRLSAANGTVTLTGIVTDAASHSPLAGATITVSGTGAMTTQSDATGHFQLANLSAGSLTMTVSAAGYTPVTTVTSANSGDSLVFQPSLTRQGSTPNSGPATLSGQAVASGSGLGLAGVQVLVNQQASATADSNGNFSLSLAAGSYALTYQLSGYNAVAQTLVVNAGDMVNLGAVLMTPIRTTTRISGVVIDSSTGLPLVRATMALPTIGVTTVTDEQGRYVFDGLTGSQFPMTASYGGYATGAAAVAVSQPSDVTQNFSLDPGLIRIGAISATPNPGGLNTDLVFTSSVWNVGAPATFMTLPLYIEDDSGNAVATAIAYANATDNTPLGVLSVASAKTRAITFRLNTGQIAPGHYRLHAVATSTGQFVPNKVIAERFGSLDISPQPHLQGTLTTNPPVEHVNNPQPVTLSAMIQNTGNVPVASHAVMAKITDANNNVVMTLQATLPDLSVQQLATVSFGSWSGATPGIYNAIMVDADGTVIGSSATINIAQAATGVFTTDRTKVGVGTQTVKGRVALQGSNSIATIMTDPLSVVIKSALQKAVVYNDTTTHNWQYTGGCAGCHIAGQAIIGGELNNKIAPRNADARNAMFNAIVADQGGDGRADGTFGGVSGFYTVGVTQTSLNMWGLSAWQNPADSISPLVAGTDFLAKSQGSDGGWTGDNSHQGWWYDDYSDKALAAYDINHASQIVAANPSLPIRKLSAVSNWLGSAASNQNAGKLLTRDESGNIYILSSTDNSVLRVGADGSVQTILAAASTNNTPLTDIRVRDGKLYAAYSYGSSGGILVQDLNGNRLAIYSSPDGYVFNKFDVAANGDIYASTAHGDSTGETGALYLISGGQVSILSNVPDYFPGEPIAGVRRTEDGRLYLLGAQHAQLFQLMPDHSIKMLSVQGSYNANGKRYASIGEGLALDNSGRILISTYESDAEASSLSRFEANGTLTKLAIEPWYTYIHLSAAVQLPDGSYVVVPVQGGAIIQAAADSFFSAGDTAALQSEYGTAMQKAWGYWQGHMPSASDTDNLHFAFALMALGNIAEYFDSNNQAATAAQVRAQMQPLVQVLRTRQGTDGGWNDPARNASYGTQAPITASDPLVTAIVGYGLIYAQPSPQDAMLRNAINYVLVNQQADGSWQSQIMGTKIANTTWAAIFLPIALDRLGAISADLYMSFASNVQLANPTLAPTDSAANADGSVQYHWNFSNLQTAGQELDFDLTLADVKPSELRPAATDAHLALVNSFTGTQVDAPMAIPVITTTSASAFVVGTDQPSYGANNPVAITADVSNVGDSILGGSVHMVVYAADGTQVADLGSQPFSGLAPSAQQALNAAWNTATLLPNTYYVQATLLDGNGAPVSTAKSTFIIAASSASGSLVGAAITTDKVSYGPLDTVQVTDRVSNLTSNALVGNLTLATQVKDPSGQVVWSHQDTVQQLVSGALKDFSGSMALANAAPGVYTTSMTVTDSTGATQATASGSFAVQSTALTGAGLGATLGLAATSLNGHNLISGDVLTLNANVTNNGNAAVSNLPVTVTVVDPASGAAVGQWQDTIASLPMAGSAPLSHTWLSHGSYGQNLIVVVQSALTGSKALAQVYITLLKPTATVSYGSDQPAYDINSSVVLSSTATSTTSIPLIGLSLSEQILKPDGSMFWQATVPNQTLAADSTLPAHKDSVDLGRAAPGTYVANLSLLDGGGVALAQGTTSFQVKSTAVTGAGLTGSLSLSGATLSGQNMVKGDTLTVTATLTNLGNAAVSNLPVTISVFDAATGTLVTQWQDTVASLAMDANSALTHTWGTQGNYGQGFNLVITTGLTGSSKLAQLPLTLVKPPVALTYTADKTAYDVGGVAGLSTTATTTAPIALNGLSLQETILKPDGTTVFWQTTLANQSLPAKGAFTHPDQVSLGRALPGVYQAQESLLDANGVLLAQASTSFTMTSTATTGSGINSVISLSGASLSGQSIVKGDTVTVSAKLSNLGNADVANLPVTVSVYDTGTGTLVTQWQDTVAALAMDANTTLTHSWVTQGSYGRNLNVVITTGLTGSNMLAQAPFTLSKPVLTLAYTSDKPVYDVNDAATLSSSVVNTAPLALSGLTLSEQLSKPDGTVVWQSSYSGQALAAKGNLTRQDTANMGRNAAGTYTAQLTVQDADGVVLAQTSVAVQVRSTAISGAGLNGSVSITPATGVPESTTAVLSVNVSNMGNADLSNLPLTLVVTDMGTGLVVKQFSLTAAALAQNATYTQGQSWAPPGKQGTVYDVKLQTSLNGGSTTPRLLAETSFTMLAPPVKLGVQTQWGGQSRVLVYYSCQEGWWLNVANWTLGQHQSQCFADRASTLHRVLDQQGVPYTLVTEQDDFIRELRSGRYNNYWLLGAVELLPDDLVDELREAVNRGDSLVIDGGLQAWSNTSFYSMVGAQYRGRLHFNDNQMSTFTAPVYAGMGAQNPLSTVGLPLYLQPINGKATATYDGSRCWQVDKLLSLTDWLFWNKPTVFASAVANPYGQGKVLAFAFDLVGTLQTTSAPTKWQEMLKETLAYTVPADSQPTAVVPGEYLRQVLVITNQANAVDFTATVHLPAGASVVTSTPAGTLNADGSYSIPVHLDVNAVQTVDIGLRAPTTAGSYSVTTTIRAGSMSYDYASYTQNFGVGASSQRQSSARNAVSALQPPFLSLDVLTKTSALNHFDLGVQYYNQGKLAAAIDNMADAGEDLGNLTQVDGSAARYSVDQVLHDWQEQWWRSPCGSYSAGSVPWSCKP